MKFSRVPLLILTMSMLGCASSNGRSFGTDPGDDVWEKSTAHPAAYGASDFNLRKDQPIGSKNNLEFYYKKCDEGASPTTWFSKTSYSCNDR